MLSSLQSYKDPSCKNRSPQSCTFKSRTSGGGQCFGIGINDAKHLDADCTLVQGVTGGS